MEVEDEEDADAQKVFVTNQLFQQSVDSTQKNRVYENEDWDSDAQTSRRKSWKNFHKISYKTKQKKVFNTRRTKNAMNSSYEDSNGIEISHYPAAKINEIFEKPIELITVTHNPIISDTENLIQTKNCVNANEVSSKDFMRDVSNFPSTSHFSQPNFHNSVFQNEVSLDVSQLQPNCNRPCTSSDVSNYHINSSNRTNSPRGSILHSEYDFSSQSQLLDQILTLPDSSKPFSLENRSSQGKQLPLTRSQSNPSDIYEIFQETGPKAKSCSSCCVSKNKWIIIIGVLLAIVCLTTIGNLCYFFILQQSSINVNSGADTENVTTTHVLTTTVLHGLKGELSQIQFCGAYPASYIYAFDAESPEATTSSSPNVETTVHFETSTNSIEEHSGSASNNLIDRSPDEPIIRHTRVVGGRNTPAGAVPWQASLYVYYEGMTCGGCIIMKNWILTAAHCTILKPDPKWWNVYVGMTRLSKKNDFPGVRKSVIKIIQHEKYRDNKTYDYDISLLKLDSDLEYSEFIQPICVPPWNYDFPDGMSCYVSGWGTKKDAEHSPDADILQRARINIIERKTCKSLYKHWLTDRMLCAGKLEGGKDGCEGDSGGPLSCYDPRKDVWMLAGSVSWGVGCGHPQRPGVYAKISYFSKWIWTKIGEDEGWIPKDAPFPKVIKQQM